MYLYKRVIVSVAIILSCISCGKQEFDESIYADISQISDPVFRRKIVAIYDTNGDGRLSKEEAAACSDYQPYGYAVHWNMEGVRTFDGIQILTRMRICYFYASSLELVDLRKINTACVFEGCINLQTAYVNAAVNIWERAYKDCKNLKNVVISGTKKYPDLDMLQIGNEAFKGCENLRMVYFKEEVKIPKIDYIQRDLGAGKDIYHYYTDGYVDLTAFDGVPNNCLFYMPISKKELVEENYQKTEFWTKWYKNIRYYEPKDVAKIESSIAEIASIVD